MYAAVIRTVVPVVVGALLGWAAAIGLNLPEGAVTEIVTVVVTTVYYAIARWVEMHWPAVGRFFLSLGLTNKSPEYKRTNQRLAA
jgi:hypothetical protein